jgi:phosphoribosylaminoimidazole carboxylase PurK protein
VKRLPARVGILGGGQLARMLALACSQVGATASIFASKDTDCAVEVSSHVTIDDGSLESLSKFCSSVDVVTVENEFLDLSRVDKALNGVSFLPTIKTLSKIQSKLDQKRSLKAAGVATLPFVEVKNLDDMKTSLGEFGGDVVLKQARFGYDGKGTFIFEGGFDPHQFAGSHGNFEGYAEPLARFKKELAVIVTRSISGEVKTFPVVESKQDGGICLWTMAPAKVPAAVLRQAERLARKAILAFDGVGSFGVEMFWLGGTKVVVNELAPRVHNTGHYTMNGCAVSQFEQHVRAILGLPLGDTKLIYPAVAMVNILGADKEAELAQGQTIAIKGNGKFESSTWIHWYGKTGAAKKRKLGHINTAASSGAAALKKALKCRERILI